MKKNSLILVAFVWSFFTYAQVTSTKNYVYSTTYNTPVLDGNQASVTETDKTQEVTYFDGLGRPIQTIVPNAGGNNEDFISHYEYDEFGRQSKSYLPYAENLINNLGYVNNATQNVNTYYQNNFSSDFQNGFNPYSETVFEASPLGIANKQAAPGSDWKVKTDNTDHNIKLSHLVNYVNDVINFEVEYTADDFMQPNIVFKGYYEYAELNLNVIKNENWQPADGKLNTKEAYSDKNGRTILTREFVFENSAVKTLNTYYVYDYFGNLVYVISPKAADTFVINAYGATTSNYSEDITYGDLINGTPSIQINAIAGTISQNPGSDLILSFNFTIGKGRSLKTGIIKTLSTAYPDMLLGYITNGSYNFRVSIIDNHLVIDNINGLPIPQYTVVNTIFTIPISAEYTMDPIDTTVLNELCFQYKYDHKNRLVEKKIPGKGWEYIVYDKLYRPVLTQTAGDEYRNANKWMFVKYDKFSRVAYSGDYTDASSRVALQATLDSSTNSLFETRSTSFSSGGANVHYSNNAFPTANFDVNSIMYYDSYGFDTAGITEPNQLTPTPLYNQTVTSKTKGLVTGAKTKILGTTDWTTTVMGYDGKGRAIWTESRNAYLQTTDVVETKLNFLSQAEENKTVHSKSGVVTYLETIDKFAYDHAGRLLKHTQKIGTNPEELISYNKYNDFGQLVQQKVGGTPATTYTAAQGLQTIDYNYNVRGWLKSINDPTNFLGSGDLFAFAIKHNDPSTGTALYNGNISQTQWISANDNQLRTYTYTYDELDRITKAQFTNATNAAQNDSFNLESVVYDANGNIMHLHRAGDKMSNPLLADMDKLNYSYQGNKLLRVQETGQGGFGHTTPILSSDTTQQYTYDDNGNLTSDLNKNIATITYNKFNQPLHITFYNSTKYIDFVYNAGGVKQSKKVYDGANTTTTFYAGNYIYEQTLSLPILQFIAQPNGYVTVNGGNYNYVYQYKDHLGNVRLSYTKDGSGNLQIVEENHYFPFGMKHTGYNNVVSSLGNSIADRYDFNGKETLENFGLTITEMDFRQYDHALGRFNGIDLLAESAGFNKTPYHFTGNNPIIGSDPSGLLTQYQNPNVNSVPHSPYYAPHGGFMGMYGNTEHSFLDNLHNGYGIFNGSGGSEGWGGGTSYTSGFFDNGRAQAAWADAVTALVNGVGASNSLANNFNFDNGFAFDADVYLNEVTVTAYNGNSYDAALNNIIGQINDAGYHYFDMSGGSFFGNLLSGTESHFNGALDISFTALHGYNKLPKDVKRHYAYKLSKRINVKPGKIFQGVKNFSKSGGKLVSKLGPFGTVLSAGVITYEVSTGTWDAHTVVNGALLVGAGVATAFAAPAVLTGIAIYGVADYFFDISGGIDKTIGRNSGLWGD